MKSLKIKFQYHARDYVVVADGLSGDTQSNPTHLCDMVEEIDMQPQKPAVRRVFLIEDTDLLPDTVRELVKHLTGQQSALEESAAIRAARMAQAKREQTLSAPSDKAGRRSKKRTISREEAEALLFPKE